MNTTLSGDQRVEVQRRAKNQFDAYKDEGYTNAEIAVEAEANILYYAELLAQAETLKSLADLGA